MLSRRAILFIFVVFQSFLYGFSQKQTTFFVDSTILVKNYQTLLEEDVTTIHKDSLIKRLNHKVTNKSDRDIQDLTQYYLALYYFQNKEEKRAVNIINNTIGAPSLSKNTVAEFYALQGHLFNNNKAYGKAIQSYLNAIKIYQEEGHNEKKANLYYRIALIYIFIEDYQHANFYIKHCFNDPIDYFEAEKNLSYYAALIITKVRLNMLESAEYHLDRVWESMEKAKDPIGIAFINYAHSILEFSYKNYYKAQPYAVRAIKISEKHNLNNLRVFSAIILMDIHNALEEYSLALEYGFIALNAPNDYHRIAIHHSIYDGISSAYAGLGDFYNAYNYKFRTDSLKTIDWSVKNKRSMDSLLFQFQSLADENKILSQKAIIANQDSLLQQRKNHLTISIFVLVLLVLFIITIFVFNKQKIKLINNQKEVEIARAINDSEEAERNRLASELHDGLAAELTALKLELEQNETISERAFTTLNKAHKMTRVISHNLSTYFISDIGLIEALANLINGYNVNDNLQFYTNVESPINLYPKVETILYRSTQELIQNAIKHADASSIVVQVLMNENTLSISVEDNGIGIKDEDLKHSIGLNSVKQRIQLINGIFDFESSLNVGTTIFIKIQLNK